GGVVAGGGREPESRNWRSDRGPQFSCSCLSCLLLQVLCMSFEPLRDRCSATKAFDHRDAQKIAAKLVAVARNGAQLGMERLALARVLLLHVLLVLDGLPLQILLRHGAPLAVVEIEQANVGTVLDDRSELVRKIEGVVQAEIHSHATERIVDVCGIARDQEPAITVARGNALMHIIEI